MKQSALVQCIITTTITFCTTLLGTLLAFTFKKVNKTFLDFLMGTASGVMISASFWSLLSPAVNYLEEINQNIVLIPTIGFACGGIFIIITDFIFKKKEKNKYENMLELSIAVHNLPEGLAMGVAFGTLTLGLENMSIINVLLLALGIGIQNFPEGICLSLTLLDSGKTKKQALLISQVPSILEPITAIIGVIFAIYLQSILPFLLSFSAGAMIAVVCSELIPDSFNDNKSITTVGAILGFIIIMVFALIM